jgi:large subunit ribosomal protein L10
MPNIVNKFLLNELEADFKSMGSCVVLNFDKLTVELTNEIRTELREAGVEYRVVKNRLAVKAFASIGLDLSEAFSGKCGVITAEEEGAISAAKLVREFATKARRTLQTKKPPLIVTGGVIEGEAITGTAAANIADMPDKNTVRAMLASAIQGPSRGLAMCLDGLPASLARVLQAKIDKGAGSGSD